MKFNAGILALIIATPAFGQEREPNNDFDQANPIAHNDVIRGDIAQADMDYFTITTNARSTITFWTSQPRGEASLDTVITAFGPRDGNERTQLAENDDGGQGLYSRIELNDAPGGTYFIRVRGWLNRTGPYLIHCELSGGPDMSVTEFALNPMPAPGQTWGGSVRVNNGAGASPATVTRLYNGDAMVAEHQTPGIAEDGNTTVTFDNLEALPIGYHSLRVCADAENSVQELDELNNCATIDATVGLDLVTQQMTINPNPPEVGQTWSTSARIQNALPGALPATTATLYINTTYDGAAEHNQALATCAVPEIANGADHECTFNDLAGLMSGVTWIRICADTAGDVEEASETNNCAERRLAIGSDLIADNLVLDPVNPGLQQTFNAAVNITNRFAPNAPATTARLLIGEQVWGECAVPELAANATHQCQLQDLAAPPAGRLVVRFCADAADDARERNEDNNCSEVNVFNGPDLQIQQIVLNPNPPVEGRSAQALVIIRNAASDPGTQPTTINASVGGNQIGSCLTGAIGGNGIAACQIDNLQFAGGAHTVRFCADSEQVETEINEDNNCQEVSFEVEDVDDYEPDNTRLDASLIRPDDPQDHTLHNEQDLDYLFFVVNRPSEVQINTGPSQEGDAFDTRVALLAADGQEITSNDDGGEGNWSRLVRELEPATYYLRVNRGGNDAVDRYRITMRLIDLASRPPDLSPGVVVIDPAITNSGQQFTVRSTINNAANAGVSQGTVAAFTIDGNAAGECSIPELASGASAPCEIIVPGGAPPGRNVVFRLCVDPNNSMDERDETNNCGELGMHLIAIDDYEVNDTLEQATELAIDEEQSHTLHAQDDVDWLRITMSEPGTLRINTTRAENSGGDVDGRLASPGGETISRATAVGDVELSYGPADRGVFLVELRARAGTNNGVDGYSVTATHEPVDGEVNRDMRLVNVSSDPNEPAPNAAFEIDVDAHNDGNLISSPTAVALSIDGQEQARCVLPPTDPGDRTRCRDVVMPPLAEGTYELRACIDPDGELGESEEAQGNNCATLELTVGEPLPPQNDLRIQSPVLNPASPIEGEMITLRMEVFYSGDSSTPSTTVAVRVDGDLVHSCSIPALDGRMVRTARCRTLPGMLQLGADPELVEACVDPNNSISETDETNNCLRMVIAPGGLIGDEPDAYEEDNSWDTAGTIQDAQDPARGQKHNLHHGDDVDVLKFTLTRNDVINLRVPAVLGTLQVTVVDGPAGTRDAGTRLESLIELDEDGLGTTEELAPGLYAFEIKSGDGQPVASYTINAWSELGPAQPDAGPTLPDAGPPGECASHDDCTGGQRCVTDDPEPYCTNPCESVNDCPEGFQLTCREVELGTKVCIRGEAPPTVEPRPESTGCGCDAGGASSSLIVFGFALLARRRRRQAQKNKA